MHRNSIMASRPFVRSCVFWICSSVFTSVLRLRALWDRGTINTQVIPTPELSPGPRSHGGNVPPVLLCVDRGGIVGLWGFVVGLFCTYLL